MQDLPNHANPTPQDDGRSVRPAELSGWRLLAVPALLEISREMVARGEVEEEILRDHEDALIADAMRVD